MMRTLQRRVSIYAAIAAMAAKTNLAYNLWYWAEFVTQILSLIIYTYFWRAVYGDAQTVGGLTLQQTLNYILLARIFAPLMETRLIFRFGSVIRTGQIVMELLRPLDFQLKEWADSLADIGMFVVNKLPLFVIAWVFFGLRVSPDPRAWILTALMFFIGQGIIFCFDWIFACLAFYSTETWGLSMVKVGAAQFFSGALVPLAMMPGWLQTLVAALPFAQALAVPLGFLSGVTPLSEAPRALLIQLIWLVGLGLASRLIFRLAIRKVTVQGG